MTRFVSLALTLVTFLLSVHSCSDLGIDTGGFRPEQLDDGWQVSSAEAQGLDLRKFADGYKAMADLSYTYSLLVVRKGYLVGEQYFNGRTPGAPARIMSVSKSILSGLVGIALERGDLSDLDGPVLDFFPEYLSPGLDQRKRNITVRHLLTMRGGFDRDEQTYFQVRNSSNWVQSTIQLPLVSEPGQRLVYCTFGAHLLSAILTKATEVSTLEFARKHFCEPLGISIASWETDPQGIYFGGNGMELSPRDLARFGSLFLMNGRANGKQIIPVNWVEESLTDYSGWRNVTWGDVRNCGYGYLWWLGDIGSAHAFFALGHGGQLIAVFPALQMIVVSTANPDFDWETADAHERAILSIVARSIVPAAVGSN